MRQIRAKKMIKAVHTAADGWRFDVVSVGYSGPVVHGKPLRDPVNLGPGWVGFDFQKAFGRPTLLAARLKSSTTLPCRRSVVIAVGACFSSA